MSGPADGPTGDDMTPVIGTETEYGIALLGPARARELDPSLLSAAVVDAWADLQGAPSPRWHDTGTAGVTCVLSAAGTPFTEDGVFELPPPPAGLSSIALRNGGRLYVDHGHPEYATPECAGPYAAVTWDKAGERIVDTAARRAEVALAERFDLPDARLLITKNNTDGKGAAYGAHENYLVRREVPVERLVTALTPFLVSRPIMVGGGRLGGTFVTGEVPFQISQRAEFIMQPVGASTRCDRAIVNTRDEPHADAASFRRLHLILGDANMSDTCTYLRVGSTALLLAMMQEGMQEGVQEGTATTAPELANPVAALRAVSHDLSCRTALELADGRTMTPLELQWHYLREAAGYAQRLGAPWAHGVVARWEAVLTQLERDPLVLDGVVDWVTKYCLLARYRDRNSLTWDDYRMQAMDIRYHDIAADGVYQKLVRHGRASSVIPAEDVSPAITQPPTDTRAARRAECFTKYRTQLSSIGWETAVVESGVQTIHLSLGAPYQARDVLGV